MREGFNVTRSEIKAALKTVGKMSSEEKEERFAQVWVRLSASGLTIIGGTRHALVEVHLGTDVIYDRGEPFAVCLAADDAMWLADQITGRGNLFCILDDSAPELMLGLDEEDVFMPGITPQAPTIRLLAPNPVEEEAVPIPLEAVGILVRLKRFTAGPAHVGRSQESTRWATLSSGGVRVSFLAPE